MDFGAVARIAGKDFRKEGEVYIRTGEITSC